MKWILGLSSLVIIPVSMFVKTLDSYIKNLVPEIPHRNGFYGIDAPGLILQNFIIFLLTLVFALQIYSSCYTQTKKRPLKLLFAILLILNLIVSFVAGCIWSSILHGSLISKLRICEYLINQTVPTWKGTEEVLDIGCGRGLLMLAAARNLKQAAIENSLYDEKNDKETSSKVGVVIGIDIWSTRDQYENSPSNLLENARLEGVEPFIKYKTADARSLPFEDDTFDIILSSLAIHNIHEGDSSPQAQEERKKAIYEAIRVLKPGGRLGIYDILYAESEYEPLFSSHPQIYNVSKQEIYAFYQSWIITANKKL